MEENIFAIQDLTKKTQPETMKETSDVLDTAIERSRTFLLSQQHEEGYWVDELESNATITAELIFFMRFMGIENQERQKKIVNYLLKYQLEDGSWAIFFGAKGCVSTTTEAYMALKLAGISPDCPEMKKAREFIINNGGVKNVRVFTKIFLAMFGQIPWSVLPAMPVEFFLMPPWFLLNIYEMSSWSRSVIVPLLLICERRPVFPLNDDENVRELFIEKDRSFAPQYSKEGLCWHNFFIWLDRAIKQFGKLPWKPFRRYVIRKAKKWVLEHQEEEGDWAGIQPAMFNSVLAFKLHGYPLDHPVIVKGLEAIDRFCIDRDDHLVMQSCISPLWDTGISCNALMDSGLDPDDPALIRAGEFFLRKQVVKRGDWAIKNPNAQPGGWSFEFYNELYPDNDDTAEILMAWHFIGNRADADPRHKLKEFQRALSWLLSMQSRNGGWAAFDQDNNQELFNEIPFADHKAMLDPPTVDVTSRILWLLGILGFKQEHPQVRRAIDYIKNEQETDGCWFGRWGVNYIYGTWLALTGLRSIGENITESRYQRAVDWLKSRQNEDGGWGETCDSYVDRSLAGQGTSTASQTAWALMGILAGGDFRSESIQRGIRYLISQQNDKGTWWEPEFTGTGFPGHFYIKYHMYQHFFPLMALSRYRLAIRDNLLEPRKAKTGLIT